MFNVVKCSRRGLTACAFCKALIKELLDASCRATIIFSSRALKIRVNMPIMYINPLRPNNGLSQTSHCNIKGLSVSEVMRIENMITQVQVY